MLKKTFILFIFTFFYLSSYAVDLPPAFTASYIAKKGGDKVGEVNIHYQVYDGGKFMIESNAKASGLLQYIMGATQYDRTIAYKENNQLKSQQYYSEQNSNFSAHTLNSQFDWPNQQVKTTYIKKTKQKNRKTDLNDLSFDPLTVFIYLMQEVEVLKKKTLHIIEFGKSRSYEFEVIGEEAIKTQYGYLNSIKVKQKRVNKEKYTIYIWFAKSLNNLPVRGEQYKEGKLEFSVDLANIEWGRY